MHRGTADDSYGAIQYDAIIYGFCLYLVDREDLFRIAENADHSLLDGGHIIIHDFISPHPFSRVYEHQPELRSYHMDHSKLWLAHPHYTLVHQMLFPDETSITVLRKREEGAFPLEP